MSHGNKRQWILAKRPEGMPDPSEVVLQEAAIPETPPGMLLVKNHYISLDPAIRFWMSDIPNYLPPIPIGDPVRSTVAGEVIESGSDQFKPGDRVFGLGGWETHSTIPAEFCTKVPEDSEFPLHYYTNMLGAVGLTPYFAIAEVGAAKAGQTMLMSAAAGAVGSIGGQIAKLMGLKAVGIAGTDEKCRWVVDELGFDDCINYRTTQDMESAIGAACPEGVDFYFDNVGGEILDAALMNMNKDSTLLFCGTISTYNATGPVPGPYNYWQILARTITVRGYLVSDHYHRIEEGQAVLSEWLKADKLKFREHINEGIENCLDTYNLLFTGGNEGKLMLKL